MSIEFHTPSRAPAPNIAEIRQKAKKPENVWFQVYYFLSAYIVWIGVRCRWSPNQLTIAALAVNGAGLLLFQLTPVSWISITICYIVLNLGHVLDCADGHLAFVSNQRSPKGAWLDSSIDVFKIAFLTLCFIKVINTTQTSDYVGTLICSAATFAALGNIVNYAVSVAASNYGPSVDAYERNQLDLALANSAQKSRLSRPILSNLREYGNFLLILLIFAVDETFATILIIGWGIAQWLLAANRIRRVARLLA